MIFLTVGAQMPFDRLVRAVDDWAAHHRQVEICAQIGGSEYRPRRLQWVAFLEPSQLSQRMREAELIVAHAGMGSILTAWDLGRPILVLPRRADLRETRNDHQIATARHLETQGQVAVAWDEIQLHDRLDEFQRIRPPDPTAAQVSPALLATLARFVGGPAMAGRAMGNPSIGEA